MLFTGQVWSDADHSLPFFSDGRCDGLILVGMHTHTDIIPSLLDRAIPFVLINNRWEDERACWVDVDDEASAYTATEYLLSLGHRRIAMLAGEDFVGCVGRRNDGYRQASGLGGSVRTWRWSCPAASTSRPSRSALERLLRLPDRERPTALLCTTDSMAVDAVLCADQPRPPRPKRDVRDRPRRHGPGGSVLAAADHDAAAVPAASASGPWTFCCPRSKPTHPPAVTSCFRLN